VISRIIKVSVRVISPADNPYLDLNYSGYQLLLNIYHVHSFFLVNRIKTETGTSILIPSNNEKSNILRIEGSPKGVALAKAEILQMVKKLVSTQLK